MPRTPSIELHAILAEHAVDGEISYVAHSFLIWGRPRS
jgi:hypothetical protein